MPPLHNRTLDPGGKRNGRYWECGWRKRTLRSLAALPKGMVKAGKPYYHGSKLPRTVLFNGEREHCSLMLTLLSFAALLPQTTQAPVRTQAAPTAPTTQSVPAASAAAVQRFDDAVAVERAAFDTLPIAGGIGPNLVIRVALEQAMRRAINPALATLRDADRTAASEAIWQRIDEIDAENTAYVKSVSPPDGWFRSRRDGAEVARNAWLIVQHSPDRVFQSKVVTWMQPLVASGDARGTDYALLYDRTEMSAGRPQLYGSQITCNGGRLQPAAIADPAGLDRRRADMGLAPMADYLKQFKGGC